MIAALFAFTRAGVINKYFNIDLHIPKFPNSWLFVFVWPVRGVRFVEPPSLAAARGRSLLLNSGFFTFFDWWSLSSGLIVVECVYLFLFSWPLTSTSLCRIRSENSTRLISWPFAQQLVSRSRRRLLNQSRQHTRQIFLNALNGTIINQRSVNLTQKAMILISISDSSCPSY